MTKWIGAALLPLLLSGCSSVTTAFETMFAEQRQPVVEKPLWYYRGDLEITVDGETFEGVGVTGARASEMDIGITSQVNLDHVEIETCSRLVTCDNGKPCPPEFQMDRQWFGQAGQTMIYHYTPDRKEAAGSCGIYIKAFAKKDLAAWGYLALRAPDDDLPAHLDCNGTAWMFAGHSVCETKQGLIQTLSFDSPIDDYDADQECHVTQIDKKTFELRPALKQGGPCTGVFVSGARRHSLEMFGFIQSFVDGK